jgi:CheY-like chemotaxis protein
MKSPLHAALLTVVVVDDAATAHLVVQDAAEQVANCRNLELTLHQYFEPQEALDAAAWNKPDVVVMDFQTRLNGWTAARDINARTGAEVIIFTANARSAREYQEKWPVRNAVVVPKTDTEQLRESLEKAVARQVARRAIADIDYGSEEFAEKMAMHFGEACRVATV